MQRLGKVRIKTIGVRAKRHRRTGVYSIAGEKAGCQPSISVQKAGIALKT
jgi:hypothetical protein